MERVYLLLRDNQQSGPFTIGELLQQQLLPSDMIWIEGRSSAWTYLSELELVPFVKNEEEFERAQSIKNADEIEKKAEELRQRILSAPPKTYFPNHNVEIETYASPYKLEDHVKFVDHRKERRIKKNTALAELLLTCCVVGLFMIGIFKGKSFLSAKQKVQNSVATQLSSGDQHAAKKSAPISQIAITSTDTLKRADSISGMQKPKPKIKKNQIDTLNTASVQTSVVDNKNQENKKEVTVQQPAQSQENTAKKEEDVPVKKEIVSSVPEIKNNEPVKEEKKGFLRGLFKKKKKEENRQE